MSWWEIIAMFVGIPVAVCVGVGALVFWLSEDRVPDGLAGAREEHSSSVTEAARKEPGNQSGATPQDRSADLPADRGGPIADTADDEEPGGVAGDTH